MKLIEYNKWLILKEKTNTKPLLTKSEFAKCKKNGTIPKGGITVSDLTVEELNKMESDEIIE